MGSQESQVVEVDSDPVSYSAQLEMELVRQNGVSPLSSVRVPVKQPVQDEEPGVPKATVEHVLQFSVIVEQRVHPPPVLGA